MSSHVSALSRFSRLFPASFGVAGIVDGSQAMPGSRRQTVVASSLHDDAASRPDDRNADLPTAAVTGVVTGGHSEATASVAGSLNGLATPAAAAAASGAYFDRIIVVPLENTYVKDVRA